MTLAYRPTLERKVRRQKTATREAITQNQRVNAVAFPSVSYVSLICIQVRFFVENCRLHYSYEQQGRRVIVGVAVVLGFGMAALGFAYSAPWYFTAIPTLSALMALVIFIQNSHSGLRFEGDALTLFKDRWRRVIDLGTIRGVRVTQWSDGQPSIWLDLDHAPAYRLPGYCFGSTAPLLDAFRKRGIAVA